MELHLRAAVLTAVLCSAVSAPAQSVTPQELNTRFQRMDAAITAGRLDEAVTTGEGLMGVFKGPPAAPLSRPQWDLGRANVAFKLGKSYLRRDGPGDHTSAIDRFLIARDTFAGFDSTNERISLAHSEHQLGYLYLRAADYVRAEGHLESCLAILKANGQSRSGTAGQAYSDLGRVHELRGDLATAKENYDRAVAILRGLPGHQWDFACALDNLGSWHFERGQFAEARARFQEGLRIRERLKDEARDRAGELAESHINLGTVDWEQGRLPQAATEYRTAQRLLGQAAKGSSRERALLDHNLASVLAASGDFDAAEGLFRGSVALLERGAGGADDPELAGVRIRMAGVSANRGRWDDCRREADLARRSLQRHIAEVVAPLTETEQIGFLQNRDKLWLHSCLTMALLGRDQQPMIDASAEWVLNGKGTLLPLVAARLTSARDQQADATFEDLFGVRGALSGLQFRRDAASAGIAKERDRLLERERELDRHLAHAHRRSASGREDRWVELSAVQRRLRETGGVLVDIVRVDVLEIAHRGVEWPKKDGQEQYAAWVTTPDAPPRLIPLGGAAEIEKAVDAFLQLQEEQEKAARDTGNAAFVEGEKEIRARLRVLTRSLWAPIEPSVGEGKRLFISPDAGLWQVPWAALLDGDGFLIERNSIHLLHSGRELLNDAPVADGPAVIVAGIDYGLIPKEPVNTLGFLPLGYSLPEGVEAADHLKRWTGRDPITLFESDATEGAFRQKARRPRAVLLSTHGFAVPGEESDPGNPLFRCGMAFARANRRGVDDPGNEDGILFGVEILRLDLRGTDVVVLSACESAVGRVSRGVKGGTNVLYSDTVSEGVRGLHYAFLMAGAKSVVGTLWEVSDRDNAYLVVGFFEALADGKDKAEALRTAQRGWIEELRAKHGFAHPFLWAGLTISGM